MKLLIIWFLTLHKPMCNKRFTYFRIKEYFMQLWTQHALKDISPTILSEDSIILKYVNRLLHIGLCSVKNQIINNFIFLYFFLTYFFTIFSLIWQHFFKFCKSKCTILRKENLALNISNIKGNIKYCYFNYILHR